MQLHCQWINLVLKRYYGLGATLYSLLLRRLIIQICCHIAIGMSHCHSRLKEIFGTRSGIHLMSTLANSSIGCCIYVPLQVVVISRIQKLVAKIDLI